MLKEKQPSEATSEMVCRNHTTCWCDIPQEKAKRKRWRLLETGENVFSGHWRTMEDPCCHMLLHGDLPEVTPFWMSNILEHTAYRWPALIHYTDCNHIPGGWSNEANVAQPVWTKCSCRYGYVQLSVSFVEQTLCGGFDASVPSHTVTSFLKGCFCLVNCSTRAKSEQTRQCCTTSHNLQIIFTNVYASSI